MKTKSKKRFRPDEISTFCSQLALLLKGGIILSEGVYMLSEEMEDGATREVLKAIDESMRSGIPFSKSLAASGAFPTYMLNMIYIGETTGRLEEVLNSLSEYYDRECLVSAGIKSVISFPCMLFVMMAVILTVLVTKILPMFETIFSELEQKSADTERVMHSSILSGKIVSCIIIAFVVILIGTLSAYRIINGPNSLVELVFKLPFTRKLSALLETGNFISALSIMMANGLESQEAVERAIEVIGDRATREKALKTQEMMKSGRPFDEALTETGLLTGMQGRMLGAGIKAGTTDAVLITLSKQYDRKINEKMTNISSSIETALVVSLAFIVGFILLSVMVPLVSVIASI